MPPRSLQSCVYTTLPSGLSRSLATTRCNESKAPRPVTSNLVNELRSNSATRSRVARCSAATRLEPVRLPLEAGFVDGVLREPIRPLPAELRAVHCAALLEDLPQRTAACIARHRQFLARIVQVVIRAIGMDRALVQCTRAGMEVAEAAQVERPEVHLRVALHDPFGHRAPRPAGRGDAGGEAAGDEHVVALGGLAHDRLAVGRHRDRAVDQLLQSQLAERRDALGGRRARSPRSAPCSAAAAPARTRTARRRRGTKACPSPSRRPRSHRPRA